MFLLTLESGFTKNTFLDLSFQIAIDIAGYIFFNAEIAKSVLQKVNRVKQFFCDPLKMTVHMIRMTEHTLRDLC